MEKTKQAQAEKLQIKLDKLLQTKEKRQSAFEKSKQELNAVSKEIDSVKLKLFEILQSGSDDSAFSNWAKRKISENEKSANPEKPITQNNQNRQSPTAQNQQPHVSQNSPTHTGQKPNQRQ
jgi:hypothetical protein